MKLGTIQVSYLSSYNIGAKTKKPTYVYVIRLNPGWLEEKAT